MLENCRISGIADPNLVPNKELYEKHGVLEISRVGRDECACDGVHHTSPLYSTIFILRVHSNSSGNNSAVHARANTHAGIHTYYIRAGRVRAEYYRLGDDLV